MLPASFFARDVVQVARELLGCVVTHGDVALRITETEAYHHTESASHACRGRTPRTAPMWGPPGHAYIYLCYGIHQMLNLVCEDDGVAAAVLIRGGVVVAGEEVVRQRRRGKLDCIGPGKVGQALGVDTSMSGIALSGVLGVGEGPDPAVIEVTRRVGIDYAEPQDRERLWRFVGRFDADQ